LRALAPLYELRTSAAGRELNLNSLL